MVEKFKEERLDKIKKRVGQPIDHGFDKLKRIEKETNFSIYLGAGLYEICVGMFIALLISFISTLPIIMAYPYLSAPLLWVLWIFGWTCFIFGIITSVSPYLKSKFNEKSSKILSMILKVNRVLVFILIPLGIFLGKTLSSDLKKLDESEREQRPDNTFIKIKRILQIPHPIFYLTLVAGLIHVLIGILLIMVPSFIPTDIYQLGYPYLNDDMLRFISSLGWISLISGSIIFIGSPFSIKIGSFNSPKDESILFKGIRFVVLGASCFLLLVFPIGTFFGLVIILEFNSIKESSKN